MFNINYDSVNEGIVAWTTFPFLVLVLGGPQCRWYAAFGFNGIQCFSCLLLSSSRNQLVDIIQNSISNVYTCDIHFLSFLLFMTRETSKPSRTLIKVDGPIVNWSVVDNIQNSISNVYTFCFNPHMFPCKYFVTR